jgi:hypothetical protein
MKETSRRQILQGMAGASMLPTLSFLKTSATPQPFKIGGEKTEVITHSQTLAVVFHGLFAFLFGSQGDPIEILVPSVPGHRYWAGNFGQEDENQIGNGEMLQLDGVKAGNWKENFDFPFLGNLSTADPLKVHCQIMIPWPDCIMFDRQVSPASDGSFFTSPSTLKPTQLPTIYGFMYYDTTITSRPELAGTAWKAPRTMGQPGSSVNANLHIRAEHCGVGNANGWDVFNRLFGLTGTDSVVLNPNCTLVGGANGMLPTVPPGEDDFLAQEPQCGGHKDHSDKKRNSPTNCASIGGRG